MENIVFPDQLASEKPADLDLQCFQKRMSEYSIGQWYVVRVTDKKSEFRALDHLMLGPKFGPFPMSNSIMFFSQFQTKIPNLTKKFFFFFFFFFVCVCVGGGGGFSMFISYNTNTEHIVTYLQFHRIIEYNHTCFFLSLSS